MEYKVRLKARAKRFFLDQPKKHQRFLIRELEGLKRNPKPDNSRELDSENQIYKLKGKRFSILYQLRKNKLLVLVVYIGNRWETARFYKELIKRIKKRLS